MYIFTYTVQTLGNIVFLKEVSYAHQAYSIFDQKCRKNDNIEIWNIITT